MHPVSHRPESHCYEIRIILTPLGLSWVGTTKSTQISKPIEGLNIQNSKDLQPVEADCTISESQTAFRKTEYPKALQPTEAGYKISENQAAFRNGQEQARTPPVLGLALAIAEEIGLEPKQKEIFINFMAARFPSELDELYIKEWAGRFWGNRELVYRDKDSAAVLLSIHRTLTGENPLLNIEAKH